MTKEQVLMLVCVSRDVLKDTSEAEMQEPERHKTYRDGYIAALDDVERWLTSEK